MKIFGKNISSGMVAAVSAALVVLVVILVKHFTNAQTEKLPAKQVSPEIKKHLEHLADIGDEGAFLHEKISTGMSEEEARDLLEEMKQAIQDMREATENNNDSSGGGGGGGGTGGPYNYNQGTQTQTTPLINVVPVKNVFSTPIIKPKNLGGIAKVNTTKSTANTQRNANNNKKQLNTKHK